MRFIRATGCRSTEACEAEWTDVDLERGVWTVRRHKSRRYSKRAKVIALCADTRELLSHLRLLGDTGVIFRTQRGRPWNRRTLYQTLRRTCKKHGISCPASIHGLRHQFGTTAIANGAPVKLVSHQLGHASSGVTERYYCHLGADHIEQMRAAAELGAANR